jgi:ElaB/YqjD/DUF883 family membrane-anchored ribosome-binding protein
MSSKDTEARQEHAADREVADMPERKGDGSETADPGELRQEIEETREELGATVAAIAEKADVKAQAKAKADAGKAQAKEKADAAKAQAKEMADAAKAQAKEKVDAAKGELHQKQDEAKAKVGEAGGQIRERPFPTAAVATGLLVSLALLWWWRRD